MGGLISKPPGYFYSEKIYGIENPNSVPKAFGIFMSLCLPKSVIKRIFRANGKIGYAEKANDADFSISEIAKLIVRAMKSGSL